MAMAMKVAGHNRFSRGYMRDRCSCSRWRRKRGLGLATSWSFWDGEGYSRSALGIREVEEDGSLWNLLDRSDKVSRQVVELEGEEERQEEEEEEGEEESVLATEQNWTGWSDLPEDLQLRILAQVPFHKLLQARVVCKAWNSVILSRELCGLVDKEVSVCSSRSRAYFPMLLQKKGLRQVVAYEFGAQKWLRLPFFSFLPSDVNHMSRRCRRRQTLFPIFGAGGLLCCTKEAPDAAGCVFTVFNPLTTFCKELPLLPATLTSDDCFHMLVQEGATVFQIVAVQEESSRDIHVYSSLSKSWLLVPLPRRCQGWSFLGRTTICNGILYCVGGASDMIAYDLQQQVWMDVLDTLPHSFFLLKRLISCDGKLFGVAVMRHCEYHFFILQLNFQTLRWLVAAKFPKHLDGYPPNLHCRNLSPNAQCVAHQGRLCFIDRIAERWIMLVYDISKKAWSLLPSCPFFDSTESAEYQVVSSAFQPNFGLTLT